MIRLRTCRVIVNDVCVYATVPIQRRGIGDDRGRDDQRNESRLSKGTYEDSEREGKNNSHPQAHKYLRIYIHTYMRTYAHTYTDAYIHA